MYCLLSICKEAEVLAANIPKLAILEAPTASNYCKIKRCIAHINSCTRSPCINPSIKILVIIS